MSLAILCRWFPHRWRKHELLARVYECRWCGEQFKVMPNFWGGG